VFVHLLVRSSHVLTVWILLTPDRSGWGGGGRKWHSHPYDQDGWGITKRYSGLGLVRTLIYPEGSSIALGGQLAVVPGYHL
jgi:hypothetical protein